MELIYENVITNELILVHPTRKVYGFFTTSTETGLNLLIGPITMRTNYVLIGEL